MSIAESYLSENSRQVIDRNGFSCRDSERCLPSPRVRRTFRQRIGDRFQFYRHQVKGWKSPNKAADEIDGIDSKTIEAIEDGAGNPRWSSIEAFAKGIGVPFERLVREALQPTSAERGLDPETRELLRLFSELTEAADRRYVLDTVQWTLKAHHQRVAGVPASDGHAGGPEDSAPDKH